MNEEQAKRIIEILESVEKLLKSVIITGENSLDVHVCGAVDVYAPDGIGTYEHRS